MWTLQSLYSPLIHLLKWQAYDVVYIHNTCKHILTFPTEVRKTNISYYISAADPIHRQETSELYIVSKVFSRSV